MRLKPTTPTGETTSHKAEEKKMAMSTKNKTPNNSQDLCPLLELPLPECHCVNMDSRKVALAVEFCMLHYQCCAIYRHLTGQTERAKDIDISIPA